MRSTLRLFWISSLLFSLGQAEAQQPPRLTAVPGDTVSTYSGVRVTDPYRALEDLDAPATKAWVAGQAQYTREELDRLPGLSALHARITALDAERLPAILSLSVAPSGEWFYLKRLGGESVAKLYVRASASAPERILLDPVAWQQRDGRHYAINNFSVAPDGKHVAAVVSVNDAELGELQVYDSRSGEAVLPAVPGIWGELTAAWSRDGRSMQYEQGAGAVSGGEAFGKMQIFEHRLDGTADRKLMGWQESFGPEVGAKDWIAIDALGSDTYTLAGRSEGVSSDFRLAIARSADLARDPQHAVWTPVFGADAHVRDFAAAGHWLYARTFGAAPRYRILRFDLDRPASAPVEVVAQQKGVIDALGAARDGLYYVVREGSISTLYRIAHGDATGRAAPVDLPFSGAVSLLDANPDVAGVVLSLEGWTHDRQILRAEGAKVTLTSVVPPGTSKIGEDWVSEETTCTSHDGVEVPMSIVYQRGLARDGSHPTLVDGYGGYGNPEPAYFNRRMQAWFERGGIFVEVKPRGGGAYGRDWYQAGVGAQKANTWKDMIACSEALVARGYTSPAKLAVHGTSMGGVAAGRALTERPDLFAVGIVRVGITDTVRFVEATSNGPNHELEMGSVKTEQGIRQLLAMSTYEHIEAGTRYPAVLFTAGLNDNRVAPWITFKTFARMSAATASGRPVLLRVETDAGHGMSSTSEQRNSELADRLAFILWNTGDREFAPANSRSPGR